MTTRTEHRWMTTGQVAELFGVTGKTVQSWTERGLLTGHRTLGGHRRFDRAEVEELAWASGVKP